jgi:hypothetical protein
MAVLFRSEDHSYHSVNPEEKVKWLSVTTVVGAFKQPFDAATQAIKSAKNKKSKWYGMTPEEIQGAWQKESKRSTDLGTFYHNQRESDILELETLERNGVVVPIFRPQMNGGIKIAPNQRLTNGVYPEHFVYLKSAGVCGQSDLVEVVNDTISITDYKTNKKIDTESYKNWEGTYQMMTGPVSHIQDCNLNHYALQLSMYMYIMLKHNPRLKPGSLIIHHVTFDVVGEDKFGYPITALDLQGNPVVKSVEPIELPYYKQEVIDIIHWLNDNRDKVKKK